MITLREARNACVISLTAGVLFCVAVCAIL